MLWVFGTDFVNHFYFFIYFDNLSPFRMAESGRHVHVSQARRAVF